MGNGGCGVVNIGQELCSGTTLAVKAVARKSTPEFTPPTLAEFRQEIDILKMLTSHPHVICLHEYLVSPNHMYTVFNTHAWKFIKLILGVFDIQK